MVYRGNFITPAGRSRAVAGLELSLVGEVRPSQVLAWFQRGLRLAYKLRQKPKPLIHQEKSR